MEVTCQELAPATARNMACAFREPSFYSDSYEIKKPLDSIYHQMLQKSVAAIIEMTGFEFVGEEVLQLLLYLAENFIGQLCRNSRLTTESAGRSETTAEDVFLNLKIVGKSFLEICKFLKYAQSHQHMAIAEPEHSFVQDEPKISILVDPLPHPPEYKGLKFLPPFPQPHTYHRTQVFKDVFSGVTQQEMVRRTTCENKRSAENSLEHFALRTCPSVSLFEKSKLDQCLFPPFYQVLLPVEEDQPYLSALITENDLEKNEQKDSIIRILQKELEEDDDEDMI